MILSSTFQAPRGIRHVLYATEPGEVTPLFSFLFQALHQAGVVETTRLPTNPPPPLRGRAGVGGKTSRQVQNQDKTLKIPFIFAAVTPHPNPPPQGGRERLLIIMFLINNMQMWVIGWVETYRSVKQTLLLAFDWVQYFFSSAIHGPQKRSEN